MDRVIATQHLTLHHAVITLLHVIRTQIQLTEVQDRRLRRLAQRDGISLAEAIRRCIDAAPSGGPDRSQAYAVARTIVGAFQDRDRARDVSRRHDDYLSDAFG
jgi:hypothetical protein